MRVGAGVVTVPLVLCADDLRSGRLVRILPKCLFDKKDLRSVYPSSRQLPRRVRLFVDLVVAEFRAPNTYI